MKVKAVLAEFLKRIFGHNMNSGSLQKLETDKFARADQEGKLLYLDDDMKTEALPSTNVIKAIVTAEDEMDLEKKKPTKLSGTACLQNTGIWKWYIEVAF